MADAGRPAAARDKQPGSVRLAPRVYLAGPEVFLDNALEFAAAKKRLCAEFGFAGVFPMDVEIEKSSRSAPLEKAREIGRINEELMRGCDLLVANCTPFRGVSMDVGTAFEIGFMRALGRPVFGYTNVTEDYNLRVQVYEMLAKPSWDAGSQATGVENFGLAENLMIAGAILEYGTDLVRGTAAPGKELSDLSGFTRCLEGASRYFISNGDGPLSLPRAASR